jgi:hypothetical protein
MEYFGEYFIRDFIRNIQLADAAIIFAIRFIALLLHWSQYPLGSDIDTFNRSLKSVLKNIQSIFI